MVDRWYREEFTRESRAKCLILIGPTGTGKTSFAKSLPGHYNYFKGRWRMKSWKDSADYSIFDDIDWDEFENLGFPSKKDLFTQNGITMVCVCIQSSSHAFIFFFFISSRLVINMKNLEKLISHSQQLFSSIQAELKEH